MLFRDHLCPPVCPYLSWRYRLRVGYHSKDRILPDVCLVEDCVKVLNALRVERGYIILGLQISLFKRNLSHRQ